MCGMKGVAHSGKLSPKSALPLSSTELFNLGFTTSTQLFFSPKEV